MKLLTKAYYRQDPSLLDELAIPETVKAAFRAHWAGDLAAAFAAHAQVPYGELDASLRAVMLADLALLKVKVGQKASEDLAPIVESDPLARVIYTYAVASWAFWVNHEVATQAARRMIWASLRAGMPLAALAGVFGLAHFASISGRSWLGYRVAHSIYWLSARFCFPRYFTSSLLLAAFPYTMLVTGRIHPHLKQVVALGEKHLGADPYYLALFQVSALYGYGYTGDVARAEIYSEKLRSLHRQGKLLRYAPISALMRLLPFALRGYTHLVQGDLARLMKDYDPSTCDPLINSQIYRAASVISLFMGRNEDVVAYIRKSIEFRKETRSFDAWRPFDERVLELGLRPRPFDPQSDHLSLVRVRFATPPHLSAFFIQMNSFLAPAFAKGQAWLEQQIIAKIAEHIDWHDFALFEVAPAGNLSDPCLRVGRHIMVLRNLPAARREYVRELTSALVPMVRSIFQSFDHEAALKEEEKLSALGVLATQVAHDIRSPLAALNVALDDLGDASEETRLIVRSAVARIHDIANSLLAKHRDGSRRQSQMSEVESEPVSVCLLTSLIETLITEKRIQYRAKLGVEIETVIEESSYALFAELQPTVFQRVLSNLINNSVEAVGEKGRVRVVLARRGQEVEVRIVDDGIGIPESVLENLTARGASFGKESGTGLGLFHAKESVAGWRGRLALSSRENQGTEVRIMLPAAAVPPWFAPAIRIEADTEVVVLDDDASVHQVWQKRFERLAGRNRPVPTRNFSRASDLETWWKGAQGLTKALFLIDFELLNDHSDGLELIETLGLAAHSYLVTSRFEEEGVRARCQALKLRILPKALAGIVPISTAALRETAVGEASARGFQ